MAARKGKARRAVPAAGRATPKGRTAPATRPRRRWLLRALGALPGLLVGLLVLWAVAFHAFAPELPDTDELFAPTRQARVTLIAADGSILDERGGEGPAYVRLGEISPWLVKAVLAVEDRRFYSHFGLDLVGTARAAVRNLLAGSYVAGGSTITQQLAKNLYLDSERTMLRKLRELFLALWLEARLSKDRILELYLNRVYFGAGAYGAEAAARTYFGKPAHALDLPEAAMLAGLLKAPSRYAPTRDIALARDRAATVLATMVDAGYIDADSAARARRQPARLAAGAGFSGHFVDAVLDGLTAHLGNPDTDRVVRTTLDPRLQRAAVEALQRHLADLPGVEGAIVLLDASGAVRALVGGRDWRTNRLDRASEIRRQPGSAFKTFAFAAALAAGRRPEDVIEDVPFSIEGWQPRNHDGRFHGRVTLEDAFARSINSVAVRLALEVGLDGVAAMARRLGIGSELTVVPSLALGTSEVTPLELTAAYLPFATGGFRRPVRMVERVADGSGRILYSHLGTEARVLNSDVVAGMRRMLRAVVTGGTGRRAAIPGREVYGKTGTTQDSRDGWFVGFSGEHVVGVWIGRDDNRAVPGLSGGGVPALVARDVLQAVPAAPLVAAIPQPAPRTAPAGASPLAELFGWIDRLIHR